MIVNAFEAVYVFLSNKNSEFITKMHIPYSGKFQLVNFCAWRWPCIKSCGTNPSGPLSSAKRM